MKFPHQSRTPKHSSPPLPLFILRRNGSMHPRAPHDRSGGERSSSYAERAYSLPRPMHQQQQQQQQQMHHQSQMQRPSGSEYYTQDRRSKSRSSQNPSSGNGGAAHYAASSVTNGNGMHYQQANLNQNSGAGNSSSGHRMPESSDLYFTPTQRKYSGEVVRVFVDYNKDKK